MKDPSRNGSSAPRPLVVDENEDPVARAMRLLALATTTTRGGPPPSSSFGSFSDSPGSYCAPRIVVRREPEQHPDQRTPPQDEVSEEEEESLPIERMRLEAGLRRSAVAAAESWMSTSAQAVMSLRLQEEEKAEEEQGEDDEEQGRDDDAPCGGETTRPRAQGENNDHQEEHFGSFYPPPLPASSSFYRAAPEMTTATAKLGSHRSAFHRSSSPPPDNMRYLLLRDGASDLTGRGSGRLSPTRVNEFPPPPLCPRPHGDRPSGGELANILERALDISKGRYYSSNANTGAYDEHNNNQGGTNRYHQDSSSSNGKDSS